MPIENANFVNQLNSANPPGTDVRSEGDDHLRLVKKVLLATFPNIDGTVSVSPENLNQLDGLAENLADALLELEDADNALEIRAASELGGIELFPAGTRMLFTTAAVPVGWVREVGGEYDNSMAVVGDTGATYGGTDSPISYTHSHTTRGHQLTVSQIPAHTHSITKPELRGSTIKLGDDGLGRPRPGPVSFATGGSAQRPTGTVGMDGKHDHGESDAKSWSPKYKSAIIGKKT